jgi:polysaccharide deacetylase 2 family uncharacterized protein YibQ
MPRRKTRSLISARAPALLAAATVAVFVLAEAFLLSGSDSGQIALAHVPGLGDWSRVTRIVGKQLHEGMRVAGIPEDSLRVTVEEKASPSVEWRMGLPSDASLLRANFAMTRSLERRGARVLSGRETMGSMGESIVTMIVGLPGRPTHRVVMVKGGQPAGDETPRASLIAVVVYGFGDDDTLANRCFALPAPFAVAIPPATKTSAAFFKAAHDHHHEVVLQLPLEPINYPQVNPGPGTLLVTMSSTQIAGLVHKYVDQGHPLVGVSNHMGSLATQDMAVMTAVFRELRRNNLPFVHVSPAAGAVCRELAANLGVAYNEPDEIVDSEARQTDPKALAKRWSSILQEARDREKMAVWVRATPLTAAWLGGALAGKLPPGVRVVPLSAVIRRPVAL